MKRYIDERTGKIVNVLEKDEANKIVKILIDYFFSESTVPAGRLNLVGFLRDFIKLGDIEDLNKIVEYIEEYKKTLKLSKEDEENFEVLYKFFRMYKDLEDAKLGIEDATNYISEMTNKKEEVAKKEEKDLAKKDKILKVFFDNGFEFKRLAKVACDAWENHLKEQMNSGKKEVYVSLEQEIAYQDLLEFATSDSDEVSIKTDIVAEPIKEKIESKPEINVKSEEKNEEKNSKVDINVQVPDRKEPVKIEIETKNETKEEKSNEKEVQIQSQMQSTLSQNKLANNSAAENMEKKEEKIPTIQINPLIDDEDEMISGGNNGEKTQNSSKEVKNAEEHHKITQHDINSLLGLDDDLLNNSNNSNAVHKDNAPNVEKKEEKIPTIQINHLVDEKKETQNKPNEELNTQKQQVNNEEKNRKEQGYTSNIHIFVPGVDDAKEPNNVNPSDVKKATENVNLKDSVDFFSNVLDDRMSKNSLLSDDDESDGFRD